MTTFLLRKILILLVAVIVTCSANAQTGNTFNLNIANGLPTNHVYSTIVDRHGYLWIATDNGVLRYNGYELKIFTTEDGLPVNDVWQLVEDRKGRIWLGNITNKMGYIFNERYVNAIFEKPNNHIIYPMFLKLNDGHINFYSNSRSDNLHESYFREQNDTIRSYTLTDELRKFLPELQITGKDFQTISPIANEDGHTWIIYDNKFYKFSINRKKIIISKVVPTNENKLNEILGANNYLFIDNYILLFFYDNRNYLEVYNVNNGAKEIISLKEQGINEPIINIYHNNSKANKNIYVITKNYIVQYQFNNKVIYAGTTTIKRELGTTQLTTQNITSYIPDELWGKCISSAADGLFIKSSTDSNLKKWDEVDLNGYHFLGGDESYCIWVNKTNDICIIDSLLHVNKIHAIDKQETLYGVLKKQNSVYYLLGKQNYLLNVKTNKASRLPDVALGVSIFKMIKDKPDNNYCINTIGLYSINPDSGVSTKNYIECDRYRDLIYDSTRHTYWTYNFNKITTLHNGQKSIITQDSFSKFGVVRTEKIAIDNKFGNIFFKGNDAITMYDEERNHFQYLFPNINLKESSMCVYDNTLIAYGRFGVAFCKITGKQKISDPIYYRNIKNSLYNFIYDAQFAYNKLIINTDKGVYLSDLPTNFENNTNEYNNKYKLTYNYKNEINDLKNGDTIFMDQYDPSIRFDIINPYGNGNLRYKITIGSTISLLNSNEFVLSNEQRTPDEYSKIVVIAYDGVWKSKPISINIYIRPYWWQTKRMQIVLWATGTLVVILLFALAILITRRLVLNASKKRNLRMEMELKAIYSQINPHFIFNSLNSALLLVSKNQMEEAYTHISKFSRLLRSYIKSSRNKFITVNEEIINLSNYIELQQIRFKNRFSYTINSHNLTNRTVRIPSLLIQPFVENAIEHGLLNKDDIGQLNINFNMIGDNTLICTIDDNGVGREEAKKISGLNVSKEESYGNLLIKDLINIFNKYESVNVDISYLDKKAPETGTTVTITIKYENNAK